MQMIRLGAFFLKFSLGILVPAVHMGKIIRVCEDHNSFCNLMNPHINSKNVSQLERHMKHENRDVTKKPPIYAHIVIEHILHINKVSEATI